jgi:tetratricopeptide (TPR) repeat protein
MNMSATPLQPNHMQDRSLAIARHEQYVRLDPHNTLLQFKLGELYHDAGRFEDAAAAFAHCLNAAPQHVGARSRLAIALLGLHQFDRAEALLRTLLEEGYNDPALLHNLGLAVYQQRRWEEAAALFEAADQGGLNEPANLAYLARAWHHQGLTEEAIDACKRWHDMAPSKASRSYLALLYADDGHPESGVGLAQEALAEDPDDVDANVVMGLWSIEQQHTEDALRHCEQALRADAQNGRAWLGVGLARLHEQAHGPAIEALENAVRIHPDNPGINVTLGWARLVTSDFAGAQKVFEQAIQVESRFAESHGGLAVALAYQGQLDRAEAAIRIAKRLDPTSMGADIAKTVVLASHGDVQAGSAVFSRMLDRAPQQGGRTLRQHLQTYALRGQPDA